LTQQREGHIDDVASYEYSKSNPPCPTSMWKSPKARETPSCPLIYPSSRALHSSTVRLDVNTFCGTRSVVLRSFSDKNVSGRGEKWTSVRPCHPPRSRRPARCAPARWRWTAAGRSTGPWLCRGGGPCRYFWRRHRMPMPFIRNEIGFKMRVDDVEGNIYERMLRRQTRG